MEDPIGQRSMPGQAPAAVSADPAPVGWSDLREWLALIEADGRLMRIGKPVDPDEELAAITVMATRREDSPALLFENLAGNRAAPACSPTCSAPARSATRSQSASTRHCRPPT